LLLFWIGDLEEIAPSTNGAPGNSRGWKKNAQKLVAAEREFAEFMENLRHARDREEFERFMDEHRNRPGRPQ
jgi:hypothetical protein